MANFSHLHVFFAPTEGVPLGIGYRRSGSKTRVMGIPGLETKVWRYLQPSAYNTPTWRTDTGRQQKPRLLIASRGKNVFHQIPTHFKMHYFFLLNLSIIIMFISRLPERPKTHWTGYHKAAKRQKKTFCQPKFVIDILTLKLICTACYSLMSTHRNVISVPKGRSKNQ